MTLTREWVERHSAGFASLASSESRQPESVKQEARNIVELCRHWLATERSQSEQSQQSCSDARDAVSDAIHTELDNALRKFPEWPTDPLHALAVLGEEFGELTKAVLQLTYEPHKIRPSAVRMEAIQTAAMAVRFVRSLEHYQYAPSEQHEQPIDASMTQKESQT